MSLKFYLHIDKKRYLCQVNFKKDIMKKFLAVIFAAFTVVSCFSDEPQNTLNYDLLASFEYAYDNQVKDFFGSDSLYIDTQQGLGMGWGEMAFYHKLNDEKTELQGGFILSCLKGNVYKDGYEPVKDVDMFRVNAPADSSRTYMVFVDAEGTMPVHDVEFIYDNLGSCTLIACMVNIPTYVAYAISNEFKDGDVLKLTATGYREGKVTNETSIDLATCADGKITLTEMWKVFNLTTLGDIQYVEFDVFSSNGNVPEVICLDNFAAKLALSY